MCHANISAETIYAQLTLFTMSVGQLKANLVYWFNLFSLKNPTPLPYDIYAFLGNFDTPGSKTSQIKVVTFEFNIFFPVCISLDLC